MAGTKYRVDRADEKKTPLGMNSLLFLGNNKQKAVEAYNIARSGYNCWGQPDARYGIILSEWVGTGLTGEYKVIASKGLP